MKILNLPLMSRWENWVMVLLTLIIAFFAINSVSSLVTTNSGDK